MPPFTYDYSAKFERNIAGGRLIALFNDIDDQGPEGVVVFTSIGIPATTSWWMVPNTHAWIRN